MIGEESTKECPSRGMDVVAVQQFKKGGGGRALAGRSCCLAATHEILTQTCIFILIVLRVMDWPCDTHQAQHAPHIRQWISLRSRALESGVDHSSDEPPNACVMGATACRQQGSVELRVSFTLPFMRLQVACRCWAHKPGMQLLNLHADHSQLTYMNWHTLACKVQNIIHQLEDAQSCIAQAIGPGQGSQQRGVYPGTFPASLCCPDGPFLQAQPCSASLLRWPVLPARQH